MGVDGLLLSLFLVAGRDVPLPPPPNYEPGTFKFGPAAAPSTPAAKPRSRVLRVGVPEPRVVGDVSPRELAVLSQALVIEVRKVDGVGAVGMAEIRAVLSQEYRRQMMGCEANQECLAEIAGALGVDELVSSELVVQEDVSTFTLSRIDMRSTRVLANVQKRLTRKRGGEEVLGAIGEVVAALFKDRPLRVGETRGVAPQVGRWLNPPPLPRWIFFSTVAAAAAAGAGGVAYGLASNSTRDEYNDLVRSATSVSGAELVRLEDQATEQRDRAVLLFGVAGGFALAAGIEALFTDWHGDRAAVTLTPTGASVTVPF